MVYCDIFLFSIGEIIAIIDKYMIIFKKTLILISQKSIKSVLKMTEFPTMHYISCNANQAYSTCYTLEE